MVNLSSSPIGVETTHRMGHPPTLLQRPTAREFVATVLAVCLLHGLSLKSVSGGLAGAQGANTNRPFSTRLIAPPAATALAPTKPVTATKATPKPAPQVLDAAPTPQTWAMGGSEVADTTPVPDATAPETPTEAVESLANTDPTSLPTDVPAPEIQQTAPVVVSVQTQQPFTINYRVKSSGFPEGFADLVLDVRDGAYNLRLEARDFGFKRTSSGRLSDTGFVPEVYREKRPWKSEVAAHILRNREQIVFSNNAPTAPIADAQIQDELSVIVQLASVLSAAPHLQTAGAQLQYQTVRTGSADYWSFQLLTQEWITLPKGETSAIKLIRLPRHEHDTKVELWFAPSMGYQPVRILLTQSDGKTLLLQSLSDIHPVAL